MEIDIYQILKEQGLILLFLVVGLGYFVGNIRILGLPLGPTIGVLLVGLFFGHYGLTLPSAVGTFGFTLFIFSVGLRAGPSFFGTFLEDGKRYFTLSFVVALSGLALALISSRLFDFAPGFDAGLLAGALTSTPTLAAAQDAVRSGIGHFSDGLTPDQVISNISVGYAITYLVGTISVILLIRYAPRLMNMNLEAMARTYAKEKGLLARRGQAPTTEETLPVVRAYRIGPMSDGKTIEQARADLNIPVVALKVRRDGELMEASPKLELREGDLVSLVASLQAHKRLRELAEEPSRGMEAIQDVLDADLLNYHIKFHEIVVINKNVLGKPLRELDLPGNYGCFSTGLNRSGIELPITEEAVLSKGDRVQVIGEESRLRELALLLGHVEEEIEETDLVTFSLGIAFGILVGLITVSIGGIAIGLGTAGGLLITGIVVGYLGSLYPTFGRVPGAARYLLSELGLMLLMASIGLNAGGGFIAGFLDVGPLMIVSALFIAVVPLMIGYVVGRKILKMNPALLLGSLTGAMTSTPALNVVTEATKSSVPAIGYAGAYTFANVLLTFAGTVIIGL